LIDIMKNATRYDFESIAVALQNERGGKAIVAN
jgi:hypothetical protein